MTNTGSHEMPVREVLDELLGNRISYAIKDTKVMVGNTGTQIEPDAVVTGEDLVIEIESRTAKQIRGAIMDLLLSPRKKKLLIIRPTNDDVAGKKAHFEAVLAARLRRDESSAVVVLDNEPDQLQDHAAIKDGLAVLGIIV